MEVFSCASVVPFETEYLKEINWDFLFNFPYFGLLYQASLFNLDPRLETFTAYSQDPCKDMSTPKFLKHVNVALFVGEKKKIFVDVN